MVDDNKNDLSNKALAPLKKGLDLVVFDEISSDELLNLSQPIELVLAVGRNNNEPLILYIQSSEPNKDDIKWSEALGSKTASKRAKLLETAIKDNNLWRIAYICKIYQERDDDKDWFNPNECFSWMGSRSLLSSACKNGSTDGVALLLQCKDIDVNHQIYVEESFYRTPLDVLLSSSEHDKTIDILKMFIALDLKVTSSDIKHGKTSSIKELLKSVGSNIQEFKNVKAVKTLPAPDTKDNSIIEDGVIWKKLDNNSICKLTSDGEDFRLRKVFNFESSSVSECNEYLDEYDHVTTASQPIITPMSRIACKKEIEQAQKHLKKLNGV